MSVRQRYLAPANVVADTTGKLPGDLGFASADVGVVGQELLVREIGTSTETGDHVPGRKTGIDTDWIRNRPDRKFSAQSRVDIQVAQAADQVDDGALGPGHGIAAEQAEDPAFDPDIGTGLDRDTGSGPRVGDDRAVIVGTEVHVNDITEERPVTLAPLQAAHEGEIQVLQQVVKTHVGGRTILCRALDAGSPEVDRTQVAPLIRPLFGLCGDRQAGKSHTQDQTATGQYFRALSSRW